MQSTLMLLLISIKCPAIEVYYTDQHDVDEDVRTITHQGGHWNAYLESAASGVMSRGMNYVPTDSGGSVASRYCTNRTIQTKK